MADNTEAKFILNFETALAQIGTLGSGYKPPNPIAYLAAMQAKLGQILVRKQMLDQKEVVEEDKRNSREDLYKTVAPRCSSVISYCKSFFVDTNDIANLQFFVREIRGGFAKKIPLPHFTRMSEFCSYAA